jgi:hypothetical protein
MPYESRSREAIKQKHQDNDQFQRTLREKKLERRKKK